MVVDRRSRTSVLTGSIIVEVPAGLEQKQTGRQSFIYTRERRINEPQTKCAVIKLYLVPLTRLLTHSISTLIPSLSN